MADPEQRLRCGLLSDELIGWFEGGFDPGEAARHYIDTCLEGVSLFELAEHLREAPDLDMAPLVELIFFPDMPLQIHLEPLLEAHAYQPDDAAMVVTTLCRRRVLTTIQLSAGEKTDPFRIPDPVFEPFVHRLNIHRKIPGTVLSALSQRHGAETACRYSVQIRNMNISFNDATDNFFCRFLLGMAPEDEAAPSCFNLLLELLRDISVEMDPFDMLRQRTDAMHRMRNMASRFERQLRTSNMETMMQLGYRPPEMGKLQAERNIFLLEKISGAVAIGGVAARRAP